MLSSFVVKSRLPLVAARSALPRALGATRSVGDTYKKKEKVEEDKYMREQEKKFVERKRAEMANKMKQQEEAEFKESIAPLMAQAKVLLKNTGDGPVSDAGLEAIARWKLDH